MTQAILNEANIATTAGKITVFNYDQTTGEYLSSSSEYLAEGVGIPAGSCTDEPYKNKKGFAVCRTTDFTAWEYIVDHRGTKVYDITTAQVSEIRELGDLPDGVTTITPDVEFPKWNGKKWVTDKTAKKEGDIEAAETKKQNLIAEVSAETQILQTKLALKRIKSDELELLNAWLDYLDLLEAVDTSLAPDIDWPLKPN
ncbi:tail fiber assembly protein (plasmid) [Arsenophonus nasoniae]|uniref:Tail fiber assembly protein n=1 Tax=Arsenophonus nasoniae TaxID=638 RepID=A0A4P7L0H1_9GAMM|nr:tail fiber assembly protein [Arsenophonus nasoniae]QBY46189.1 hypothetical protein ArsFIN_48000 [Arsenophonus nasoniae]WGM08920.1 tail fiber assembly protein [Arsenophonus nasoniae]WGM13618.1 tail fiber assembly protein [Arsenophonus nasoniae]WGM18356.1 tail fiber assembly protein [Arsenophonus nasoniae]